MSTPGPQCGEIACPLTARMYCARSKAQGSGQCIWLMLPCICCTDSYSCSSIHSRSSRSIVAQVVDAVAQQRGAQHGDVGADHEQLDHVLGAVNAAGGGQAGLDAAVENADPGQRQAQGLRRAQQNIRA